MGVLLTLLATGVIAHTTSGPRPIATLPAPRNVQPSALEQKVRALLLRQLGPSLAGQKTSRLLALRLVPVVNLPERLQPESLDSRYRSLYIEFRLNDHPLGHIWRLRAARADVFGMLKAMYTSDLPIYNTELVGRFPLPVKHGAKDTDAVVAYISHTTASRIPWRRWGRDHELQLWELLNYKFVKSGFG